MSLFTFKGHFLMKFVLSILLCGPVLVFAQSYNYDSQRNWPETYPECGGHRQSPISLSRSKDTEKVNLPKLVIHNFTRKFEDPLTLAISGLSVKLDTPDSGIVVEGGPLKNKYIFDSIHFHWGAVNSRGSEHTLDGRRTSLELHAIFVNEKYADIGEALTKDDGLTVLGVLYKAGFTIDWPWPAPVNGLNVLMDKLKYVTPETPYTFDESLSLANIFHGVNLNSFFTYDGSLTTPSCNEAVTWIVFNQVVPVNQNKIKNFRELYDNDGNQIVDNYRFIQPRGDRVVRLRN